jgi:glycosyltransferase involved in cell wall biosynthesis
LPRRIAKPYFVAMGGEARDYATLLAAAKMMPSVRFLAIVRPWSLTGLEVPDNVSVLINAPWEEAWSYVWHSEAALLPLRSARTPNGHVTIVGGMHIGKAHIVTRSTGVSDYAIDGETALLVDERSPEAFKGAIERMIDEPGLAERLGIAARAFARTYCCERVTADYFRDYLVRTHNL